MTRQEQLEELAVELSYANEDIDRLQQLEVLGHHAEMHQFDGDDEIDVTGLSGDLADAQDAKAHASTHEEGGADKVTPALHANEHSPGGDDEHIHASTHERGGADDLGGFLPLTDRQGGSATDWSVAGTTTRSAAGAQAQMGVDSWSALKGSARTVTFPDAFDDKPIVWVCLLSGHRDEITDNPIYLEPITITSTGFTVTARAAASFMSRTITFAWLAIGPEDTGP